MQIEVRKLEKYIDIYNIFRILDVYKRQIYNNEFSNLLEFNKEDLEKEILKKIFG